MPRSSPFPLESSSDRAGWALFGLSFARFAWGTLAYLLLVILFGAWVRITGSGAGCGSDWPECQGSVIPRAASTELLIEYTHRLTSGLAGLWVVAQLGWAWKSQTGRVRRASLVATGLMLVEALLGAVLVRAELVVSDASVARAVVVTLHLCNTLALAACLGLVAWWASPSERAVARLEALSGEHAEAAPRLPDRVPRVALGGWFDVRVAGLVVVIISMAGAVTALGDTVFPHGAAHTLQHAEHFLVQLRVVHPVLAVLGGLAIVKLARRVQESVPGETRVCSLATVLERAVLIQLGLGGLNVALRAPGWLQIVHLLAAYAVWLSLVFLVAESPGRPRAHGA